MSILITGMELPECCDKCPFKKYIGSDRLVCGITGYRFNVWDVGWGDKPYVRHESCPLVPIPLHGRLGDLDKLEKMFVDIDSAPYSCFDGEESFYSAEDAAHIIRLAPTIIQKETPKEET